MKINFDKIPARVNPFEDKKQDISFKEVIISYLWNKRGNTAQEARFALDLVPVTGEVDINDEQVGFIKDFAENYGLPYYARTAILEAVGIKEDKKEGK